MDAVKFLKAKNRMYKEHDCFGCPIGTKDRGCAAGTQCNDEKTVEETVKIVEKYEAEHPTKTRQSELLKIIPDAKMLDGVLDLCPERILQEFDCDEKKTCSQCLEEYWLEEVLNE